MWINWAFWAGGLLSLGIFIVLLRRSLDFRKFLQMELKESDPKANPFTGSSPLISVIIPARNEERFIETAARHTLASEYSPLELILVDDRSQDRTRAIMVRLQEEDARIKVLTLDELSEGWTGKTHSLYQGSLVASGDLFVFTDADAVISPETLSITAEYVSSKKLDMLTLAPGFSARGFIEDVIHPYLAMGLLFFYPLKHVNDKARTAALASGCYIMITKRAYEEVGTWQAFRDEITEDIALSRAVKANNLKLEMLRGDELVQTKPFESIAELFGFWKRSYYGGLGRNMRKTIGLTVIFLSLMAPFVFLALSSTALVTGNTTAGMTFLFASSSLAVASMVVPHSIFLARSDGNWLYGLAGPVALALGVCVTLATLASLIRKGGVQWRGTVYR